MVAALRAPARQWTMMPSLADMAACEKTKRGIHHAMAASMSAFAPAGAMDTSWRCHWYGGRWCQRIGVPTSGQLAW
eukprot:12374772-Alexandrium_andersonii.AAC.1